MKAQKQVNNPHGRELTYEKLKQYEGFENSTEDEAQKQIEAIKKLAKVLYYMYLNEKNKNEEEDI